MRREAVLVYPFVFVCKDSYRNTSLLMTLKKNVKVI